MDIRTEARNRGVELELDGKLAAGTKFDMTDLTESPFAAELHDLANAYIWDYSGDFEFLVSVKQAFNRNLDRQFGRYAGPREAIASVSPLELTSCAQAKGILNCLLAELRRSERQAATPAADRVTEPGIYQLANGEIYKVQKSRGSDRLYAKHLVPSSSGRLTTAGEVVDWKFEYEQGAMRLIKASDRMTEDRAREFGLQYGVCACCGRTLTVAESIERGIGPVCMKWFRW